MLKSKVIPIFGLSANRDVSLVDPSIYKPTQVSFENDPVYGTRTIETNFIAVGHVPNLVALCTPPEFLADASCEIDATAISVKSVLIETSEKEIKVAVVPVGDNGDTEYAVLQKENHLTYGCVAIFADVTRIGEYNHTDGAYRQTLVPINLSYNQQTRSLIVRPSPVNFDTKVLGVELEIHLIKQ